MDRENLNAPSKQGTLQIACSDALALLVREVEAGPGSSDIPLAYY